MKTVFIRALEAPVEDKAGTVLEALRASSSLRFVIDPVDFQAMPGSTFAYWAGATLLRAQRKYLKFEPNFGVVRVGVQTDDDPRFVRCWWEVAPFLAHSVALHTWPPFLKGTETSAFYFNHSMRLRWANGGAELKAATADAPGGRVNNETDYFKQGLSWALRTARFEPHFVPAGCIPSVSRYLALVEEGESAPCAMWNSRVVDAIAKLRMERFGHPKFIVGVIKDLPTPRPDSRLWATLAGLAVQCWRLKRRLDTRTEASLAYLLPALLQGRGTTLGERAHSWGQTSATAQAQLDAFAAEIDTHVYRIYDISDEDRQRIERGFGGSSDLVETTDDDESDGGQSREEAAEVDAAPMVASLISWTLGVAFGRFDVRLATGERETPPEPEPFDPLPVCSPGMLTGDDGLPVAAPPSEYPLTFPTDGILVDDPGHPRDLVRAVRSVFEAVFDDPSARWHEAAELLGAPDLRTFFARDCFEPHIKRYSRSRRKAPIYWQLATASGSYSVWIYIHRATGDTLFRVLNDFVGPKLDHEKAKLDELTQEAGGTPSAAQRREIEQQETFVGELQALKTEVARVAPLWKPNLDDGVILNFAPLWRLVPQSRSWQAECKKAWEKLVAGDYDWAHLAMHLWPERVIPKCMDDRSLAIAHGLEDVFWHEDDSGTWCKIQVDDTTVQKLIQERSSTTVKAALNDLLSAPALTASKGRKAKGRSASPRTSAPKRAPAAARATTPDTPVDEATLRAVKTAIANTADGVSKAEVLSATGLSDGDWNKAIAALLDRGDVTRTGQKRGARYHTLSDEKTE